MSASPSPSLPRRAAWSGQLAIRALLEQSFPYRSPSAIEAAQRRHLRATVAHAREHVPYYRETLRRLGLGPPDFRTAADLTKLPLIEREQLQRDPEYFVSRAEPLSAYARLQSGGTSGEPVVVFWDRRSLVLTGAHRQRARAVLHVAARKRLRLREARITPPMDSSAKTSSVFAQTSLIPASVRVSRITLSLLDSAAENVARLNAFRPDVIFSYGSYLEALFDHVRRSKVPFHRPRAVAYGADSLSEAMRRMISEELKIPVFSNYGAVEAFALGFECERHRGHHLNVDLYPVRIVDGNGAERPRGEPGAVIASNLVNRGTVLLNYRLGDIATRLPDGCGCSRSLPLLSFVEGRADDWVRAGDGRVIHPQQVRTPLSERDDVWRYQMAQRRPGAIEVAVVAAVGADRERLEAEVSDTLKRALGPGAEVAIEFVDSLPRTLRGKVRTVVADGGPISMMRGPR